MAKTMVSVELFNELVKHNYGFLVEDFDFDYEGTNRTERILAVDFIKNNLVVVIEYSYANHWITVSIFDNKEGVSRKEYYRLPRIMLMSFVKDYEALMPGNIPLDESVRLTAQLLKERCADILSGRKWPKREEILSS